MKRRTICMITNWYPTDTNPYQGVFFREQALALREYYDFIIVHYTYGFSRFKSESTLLKIKEEYNIIEYNLKMIMPTATKNMKKLLHLEEYDEDDLIDSCFVSTFKKNMTKTFDALYCISCQTEARFLKIIAKEYNKPYVIAEHGPFPWVGTLISSRNQEAIESADLFLAISNDKIRQIMMQGIKLPKYKYIGNLVDEKQFQLRNTENEVCTFVTVGANVFYKNYEMLFKIVNRLVQISSKKFKIIIVGYKANKGYSKDGDLFEQSIKESSISEYVELIPEIEHNKMQYIYMRSDAFIMTSIQEGMPVSSLEAACCGLPIFSTKCGGVEDYVDEKIGRIYDITDVEGFAHGLSDFLEKRIIFDSKYIRQCAIKKFGMDAFKQNFVNAFESVIEPE